MTLIFNSFQSLLVPLIVIFAIFGAIVGFWREVGRTAGMAIVVLLTVLFPDLFIGTINRIIINLPRVFGLLLNADVDALPADLVFGTPGSGRYLLARVALFVLLVVLIYRSRPAWALDVNRKLRTPFSFWQRVLGAFFGGITGFLWFVAVNDFVNSLRAIRNDPVIPPEGTTLQVPTVPDLSPLLAFVPTLVAILLIILLVLAFLRLPNLWR